MTTINHDLVPGDFMTFHPSIHCNGQYSHLAFTMVHWTVLTLPHLGIGLTYLILARNAQARPRVFDISGFLGMRVFCKIIITLYVNLASRGSFVSDIAFAVTKNMFILCCLLIMLFVVIKLMPALGPQSYEVNVARMSVFAFVVGLVLANLLNLTLQAAEVFSPAAALGGYIVLPLLVPVLVVGRFRGRARAFNANALKLSQALAGSSSLITITSDGSTTTSTMSEEEVRDVRCMMLTVRKDIMNQTMTALSSKGDIKQQVSTLQFLNSIITGSPLVRRFLFKGITHIKDIVSDILDAMEAALIRGTGTLEGSKCDLLCEAGYALLQLSRHSAYYKQTFNRDKKLIRSLVHGMNIFSHGRFIDDVNVDDKQYLSLCQHVFAFLSIVQSVDSKNTIRDRSEVLGGLIIHPASKSRHYVDRWNNDPDKYSRSHTALFLEGDIVSADKVNGTRASLWSSMVNSFGVLWDSSAPAVTKSDLKSIIRNTILGCETVQVLCVVFPTNDMLDMAEGFRLDIKEENESGGVGDVIDRVFFKVYKEFDGQDSVYKNDQSVKEVRLLHHIVHDTLHCLRTAIDNETLLGQTQASVSRRSTLKKS